MKPSPVRRDSGERLGPAHQVGRSDGVRIGRHSRLVTLFAAGVPLGSTTMPDCQRSEFAITDAKTSAGCGGANKKPWARSHPSARSSASCRSVSTPSATTREPERVAEARRPRRRSRSPRTRCRARRRTSGRPSRCRPGSGAGSRATSSRCRSRRCSGARRAPAARSIASIVVSAISTLSVISRQIRSGGRAGALERVGDLLHEIRLRELAGGEVHRDRERPPRPARRRATP